MRLRIYISPDSPLEDITGDPFLYDCNCEPDTGVCGRAALYDVDLWNRYQAALELADDLKEQLFKKLKLDPWDDTERALWAEDVRRSVDEEYDHATALKIRAKALAHAASIEEPKP